MIAPQRLAVAVDAVTKRLQLEILIEELPLLASAIKDDRVAGAHTDESAQAYVTACEASVSGNGRLPAKDVRRLMALCAVGKERISSEFGTDRMSTIAAQTVALTVSSVRKQQGWFATVGAMLSMLRLPSLLFFVATRNALIQSRTGLAVNVGMLVFGAIVVLTALYSPGFYSGWILAAGVTALVVSILLAILQSFKIIKWVILALLFLGVTALWLKRQQFLAINLAEWRTFALVGWSLIFLIVIERVERFFVALRSSRRSARRTA